MGLSANYFVDICVYQLFKKSNAVTVLKELFDSIRSTEGLKKFISVLYLVFLLQRTIFNRGPWGNPLSNPVGDWFLFLDKNTLNFEIIDNTIKYGIKLA